MAIFVASTLAQVIIQTTLLQERRSRMVAAIMDVQQTRSQRLFRDSLLLLAPDDGSRMHLIQEMQADQAAVERVNTAILVGDSGMGIAPTDFSAEELAKIRAAQPSEKAIMEAATHIVAVEKKHGASKEIVPDVTTLFYKEPIYFVAMKYIFETLNSDADARVQAVQLIEIGLYGFFVLLLIVEAAVVARPALKQFKNALDELAKQANRE